MKKNLNRNPFRHYFAGTQIAITVFVAVIGGYQIDKFFNNDKYIITITLSIVSICYTLRALIKDVNKDK